MIVKDQGICIRAIDYSDTSQIATFFTKNTGLVSIIAKGSKRRKSSFYGPIELLSIGDMLFKPSLSSSLATLTGFDRKPTFLQLRKTLFGMNCGLFAAELINNLTEEGETPDQLYDVLVEFLTDLQSADSDEQRLSFLILFQLNLLNITGSAPILDRCSNCKNANTLPIYFSSQANGLLCRDCEMSFIDKVHLSASAVKCLQDFKLLLNAEKPTLGEVEKTLIHHFSAVMHKQPKMAKYFLAQF